MRFFRMFVGLLVLLCLAPPLVLLVASFLARWAGCELDPDVPLACRILGGDYGDILQAMAHFGYYAVETLPVLATLLVIWVLIEIVRAMSKPRKSAATHTPANSRNRERGS